MSFNINPASAIYATAAVGWQAVKLVANPNPTMQVGPWRPLQWLGITGETSATNIYDGKTAYFFDAILMADHESPSKATEHPIQNKANITDHVYLLPERLTLEIGMSDVMSSCILGQFSSGASKSVSAYQMLKQLRKDRKLLQITTRLDTYQNMIIENIRAFEDRRTTYGLRAMVYFRQIFMADVKTITASTKPQITDSLNAGTKQPQNLTSQETTGFEGLQGGR
jgi:hypothetical protein